MSREVSANFLIGAAAGLGCAVIWSLQAILSRMAPAQGLSAVDISILRYAVAGLIALPYALRMSPRVRGPLTWSRALVFTLVSGTPYSTVLVGGARYAPALHSSVVLQAFTPVFTTIAIAVLGRGRPNRTRIAGLALLLAGTLSVCLGTDGSAILTEGYWRGDLMFVLAALMFASFGVLSRRWSIRPFETAVTITLLSCLTLPLWLPFSSAFEQTTLEAVAIQAAYHGIVVAVLSIFLYLETVRRLGPFVASLFLSLIPPLTAGLGAIWLSEKPNLPELLGLLTVVAGMLLAFWAEARSPTTSQNLLPKRLGTIPSIAPEARINGAREDGDEA